MFVFYFPRHNSDQFCGQYLNRSSVHNSIYHKHIAVKPASLLFLLRGNSTFIEEGEPRARQGQTDAFTMKAELADQSAARGANL